MQFKENDVSIFSCSINVTVTSQNDVRIFTLIKQFISASAVYTSINRIVMLFIALKWLKTSIRGSKLKSIHFGLQFYVKLTSI